MKRLLPLLLICTGCANPATHAPPWGSITPPTIKHSLQVGVVVPKQQPRFVTFSYSTKCAPFGQFTVVQECTNLASPVWTEKFRFLIENESVVTWTVPCDQPQKFFRAFNTL